ncbi:porin [Methyloglobulus sp.]|uniref:porin n=1 Tax=Methyloglobulus sp. TaxID=2518622 RepID=UPI0032B76E4A
MQFSITTIMFIALSMGLINSANALELYEDPVTNQVYTKPGPNRIKLGKFEKVEENAAATPQAVSKTETPKTTEENTSTANAINKDTQTAENKVEQPAEKKAETSKPKEKSMLPAGVSYGKNGFEFKTDNGKFSLAIQNRMQFRYAMPFDGDPRSIEDLEKPDSSSFMIRRARTKIRGHLYWAWLKYYFQYDWTEPVMRDLNLTVDKYDWAKVWVGRGKVFYNDERVSSSGNQQFVNRSIVNNIFTVDRQQGVQVYGNLFPETWHDISYYLGVFTGLGVGERSNDDDDMMWSGRLQWNAMGGEMPFSQSDVEYHEKPALNIAVAAATNRSKCTAFETVKDSCRALPGFEVGKSGQYRINQMMEEMRFKWKGFSVSHELHWKDVDDTVNKQTTNLMGGLIQAGFFPHYIIPIVPKNLEFAGRYAFVDPNRDVDNDLQQEASGVMTYFFNGHSNKLNFQVSHLMVEDPDTGASESDQRFWVQWDVSF